MTQRLHILDESKPVSRASTATRTVMREDQFFDGNVPVTTVWVSCPEDYFEQEVHDHDVHYGAQQMGFTIPDPYHTQRVCCDDYIMERLLGDLGLYVTSVRTERDPIGEEMIMRFDIECPADSTFEVFAEDYVLEYREEFLSNPQPL